MTDKTEAQDNGKGTVNLDDFMQDAQGRLVPKEKIAEVALLRDQVVNDLVKKALGLNGELVEKKRDAFETLMALVEVSAEQHGVHYTGKKGNMQFVSFDGLRKVKLEVKEEVGFTEEVHAAKQLIDEYCKELAEGTGSEDVQRLIYRAFKVDEKGQLSSERLMELSRYGIDHPKWLKALALISKAMVVQGEKKYVRFYERETPEHKWGQCIELNFSAVPVPVEPPSPEAKAEVAQAAEETAEETEAA